MTKLLIYGFLIYLLYKLVFNVVLPVRKGVKTVRQNMEEMQRKEKKLFTAIVDDYMQNVVLPQAVVIKSVCVSCGKPVNDFDEENNNCCDECWLSA